MKDLSTLIQIGDKCTTSRVLHIQLLSVGKAVKMKLWITDSGKFADPTLNVPFTLQETIDNGLIDGDTTVLKNLITGQYKPLKPATAEGDIDVDRGEVLYPKSKLRCIRMMLHWRKDYLWPSIERLTSRSVMIRRDLTMSPVSKTPREMTLHEAIRSHQSRNIRLS